MSIKEVNPTEFALAYAVVILRKQYPEASDIEILHYLLKKGHHGEEIPNSELIRIQELVGEVSPRPFNTMEHLAESGLSIHGPLIGLTQGEERHDGMENAMTSDGWTRALQGFIEA